jgi:4-hydroxy-tetrahydrodipicolinate synthase
MTTKATVNRRHFLTLVAAAPNFLAPAAESKALRGVFPILQSPFTRSDKLDIEALAAQVPFLDRGGVHGAVWPQLASEYSVLDVHERLEGADAIAAAARSRKIASVIGVQAPDVETATRYVKRADKAGADAVIALPLPNAGLDQIFNYYKAIGNASKLPLFIQAVGDMSVDFVARLAREIPTLRYDKDEAGATLPRITEFRKKAPQLQIFTGNHGRTLLDEMHRGSAGTMPAAGFADLYAQVWDLWQSGKRKESAEMFGRTLLLVVEVTTYGIESLKYILHLRGIFPTYHLRTRRVQSGSVAAGSGSGLANRAELDGPAKEHLQELVDILTPYFKS